MKRYKIDLVGYQDVVNFVNIVSPLKTEVDIISGKYRCTAKSLLFALGSLEWNETYCESEEDIYHLIEKYVKGGRKNKTIEYFYKKYTKSYIFT